MLLRIRIWISFFSSMIFSNGFARDCFSSLPIVKSVKMSYSCALIADSASSFDLDATIIKS